MSDFCELYENKAENNYNICEFDDLLLLCE